MDFCDANGSKRATPDMLPRVLLTVALCLLLVACEQAPPSASLTEARVTTPSTAPTATAPSANQTADVSRLTVVTATPDPSFVLDTSTSYDYTEVHDHGPQVLDPILAWDRDSQTVVRNVMETLVYPHPYESDSYVPLLATGWRLSNQGRTYTFSIRRGVRYSNGNPLTAGDVAYSLQRLLLASPPGGPQHLLLEPLLGIKAAQTFSTTTGVVTGTVDGLSPALTGAFDIVSGIDNGLYTGDRAALLANVPARTLLAVCQELQAAITASDGDGTVTVRLDRSWGPFLSILSQTWTSIVDREWAVERGAWDGSCATWQNWYAIQSEESALAATILGTGPYALDYWTPGAAYTLLSNDDYWRGDDPMWDDGPFGVPALGSVRVLQVTDANERWQLLESGAAQLAVLSRAGSLIAARQTGLICDWVRNSCEDSAIPTAPLRRVENIPLGKRQALFFNFDISSDETAFLGSAQLDGEGIPPDFFDDVHVRRAFAHCLDDGAFVDAAFAGDGVLVQSLLPAHIANLLQQPGHFPYNLRLCGDELALAWEGRLLDIGFRLQLPFATDDAPQQAAALLLQNSLRNVNPAYRLEPIALSPAELQQALSERRAPLALLSWAPAVPDAYYWIAPAFTPHVTAFQQPPPALTAAGHELLGRLRSAGDPATRRLVYRSLSQFYEQSVPFILLPEPTAILHQRRELERWVYNPADPLPYYYAFK